MEPQPLSEDIRLYIALFWRWAWLFVPLAILAGVGAYFFSKRQPQIYKASATVLISQPQATSNIASTLANEKVAQTFSKLMIQQPTLEGVITELELDVSVEYLENNIKVQVVPDTQLIKIIFEDQDPERAALVVNTIGTVFAGKNEELQASRYQETKNSLEAQLASMDQQINVTLQALDALGNISDTSAKQSLLQTKLAAYQSIYENLLQKMIVADTQFSSGENTLIEQQMEILQQQIEEVNREIQTLGDQSGIEYDLLHAKLTAYQEVYQSLIQDLVTYEAGLVSGANKETEFEYLSAQLEILEQRIKEVTNELNEVDGNTSSGVERDRLESNLVLYRQTYANLLQSYEQVRLAEIQNTSTVDFVQPATPPSRPIRPDIPQNTVLASIVGLMIGMGIAFLIEILDDTVKGPDDIIRHLGLPVLSLIARIEEDGKWPITIEHPRSPLAESFRSLRTNIQYTSVDRPLFSLMITSPSPLDGKSTVAANLGVVFAQSQRRIAIIDADLRRPFQHKKFNLPNRSGLTDALIHRGDHVDGMLHQTEVQNLSILTSGSLPPNPAELIESDRMVDIIRYIEKRVDVVIIDTPPVTAVTDPVVLAPRVDGVILVVRIGVTKLAAAKHTVEQLQQVGANLLGVVLNDVENKRSRYYHYYKGYYNDYSRYYDYSSNPPKKKRHRVSK